MPVPIMLIGAAAAGVAGIASWLDGRGRKKTARNIYSRHLQRYESDLELYKKQLMVVNENLEHLGSRRLESIPTLKLAAEFLQKARVRDRNLYQRIGISPEFLARWEGPDGNESTVISNASKSVTAGVSTAISVYGAVGAFGSASTGTAISTLSGAAAQKATLAWLGGGSMAAGGGGMAIGVITLGSLFVGPAALVTGLIKMSNAARFETEVEGKKAEMKVARVQIKQQIEVIKIYRHRICELRESIEETEKSLKRLIEVGDPAIDEDAYKVAVAAQTLGELLDTPVVEENDESLDKVSEL